MAKGLVSVFLVWSGLAVAAFGGEKPLKARAKLSYHGTGGNTKTHGAAASGEADYARGRLVVDGGGDYALSASGGKKTAESAGLFVGAKFFLTGGERLYARYKVRWQRNVFSGFEHRLSNFGGLGVYLIKSDPQELSVEGGPSYVNERYREDTDKRPASFAAVHAGADYQLFLDDISEFEASAAWDVDLKDAADQLLAADASWNVYVADWLAVHVTEKVNWDNVPPEGYGQLDVTTALGVTVRNY